MGLNEALTVHVELNCECDCELPHVEVSQSSHSHMTFISNITLFNSLVADSRALYSQNVDSNNKPRILIIEPSGSDFDSTLEGLVRGLVVIRDVFGEKASKEQLTNFLGEKIPAEKDLYSAPSRRYFAIPCQLNMLLR